MAEVQIKITSNSNISMNSLVDTGMTPEEWADAGSADRLLILQQAVWEDIEAYPVTDEDDETILEV